MLCPHIKFLALTSGSQSATVIMLSMLLSLLFLLTITTALAFGILLGRWVIFGILNFFDPARLHHKREQPAALAPAVGTD